MYIPDPIEIGEQRAEEWAETHVVGNQFLCYGCEKFFHLDEGVCATPDPYSPLVCRGCVESNAVFSGATRKP